MDYYQPENAYHFSADALLLAEFAYLGIERNILSKKRGIKAPFFLLDLGCACGIVGLEILQALQKLSPWTEDFYVIGIDKEEELVLSANLNAQKFGLDTQYRAICHNIEKKLDIDVLFQEIACLLHEKDKAIFSSRFFDLRNPRLFDAVIMNPPWYHEERGHVTQKALRKSALFGKDSMGYFFTFVDAYLKDKASLFMIAKPSCFMHCIKEMSKTFNPHYLQNVYAHKNAKRAIFFMLEAKRMGRADCVFASPKWI